MTMGKLTVNDGGRDYDNAHIKLPTHNHPQISDDKNNDVDGSSNGTSVVVEVISAALGGVVSSACLYPLEIIKTRMMTMNVHDGNNNHNNDNSHSNDSNTKMPSSTGTTATTKTQENGTMTMIGFTQQLYKAEGISSFYDGWEVSAMQSAMEKAMYFFAFTVLKALYRRCRRQRQQQQQQQQNKEELSMFTTLLLGCLAEWMHLPITLPIDAVTTVMQTRTKDKTTHPIIVEEEQEEQEHLHHHHGKSPISDHCQRKRRQSGSDSEDQDHGNRHETAMTIFLTLLKTKRLYKGIEAYVLLCFRPAIQYTIFEQVKSLIVITKKNRQRRRKDKLVGLSTDSQLSSIEAFALGMVSRAIATFIIFPFQRAKVQMQSNDNGSKEQRGGEDDAIENNRATKINSNCCNDDRNKNSASDELFLPTSNGATTTTTCATKTIWTMLAHTYKLDGVRGLYQGIGPELTRGVLSAALMMMVKERIGHSVARMVRMISRYYTNRNRRRHRHLIKSTSSQRSSSSSVRPRSGLKWIMELISIGLLLRHSDGLLIRHHTQQRKAVVRMNSVPSHHEYDTDFSSSLMPSPSSSSSLQDESILGDDQHDDDDDPDQHDHRHIYFMKLALEEARQAQTNGEVPIGALVIQHLHEIPTELYDNASTSLEHNQYDQDNNIVMFPRTSTIEHSTSSNKYFRDQNEMTTSSSSSSNDNDYYRILSRSRNSVEQYQDASGHAELLALRQAAKSIDNWRLYNCTLYTTLEPCPMCLAAAQSFRIHSIVYGAPDLRLGAIQTHMKLLQDYEHPYHTVSNVVSGVLEDDSAVLLRDFFRSRRRDQGQDRVNGTNNSSSDNNPIITTNN